MGGPGGGFLCLEEQRALLRALVATWGWQAWWVSQPRTAQGVKRSLRSEGTHRSRWSGAHPTALLFPVTPRDRHVPICMIGMGLIMGKEDAKTAVALLYALEAAGLAGGFRDSAIVSFSLPKNMLLGT